MLLEIKGYKDKLKVEKERGERMEQEIENNRNNNNKTVTNTAPPPPVMNNTNSNTNNTATTSEQIPPPPPSLSRGIPNANINRDLVSFFLFPADYMFIFSYLPISSQFLPRYPQM